MYYLADLSATLPDDLDPDHHRIICKHFLGIDPQELRDARNLIALIDDALQALTVKTESEHA